MQGAWCRALRRVSETHGLRFPREFGLLLKQLLYFDRYIQVRQRGCNKRGSLAGVPDLGVSGDERGSCVLCLSSADIGPRAAAAE